MHRNAAGIILRKGDRLCAVVNHKEETPISDLAEDIIRNVQEYLKIVISIGIGQANQGLTGIKDSYRTAVKAIGLTFFTGSGKAILWHQEKWDSTVSEKKLGEARQGVLQSLLSKDRARLNVELMTLFERIPQYSGGSREKAVMACYGSLIEWLEGLEEVGIKPAESDSERKDHLSAM